MIFNIIMFAVFLPVMLVVYFVLRNEAKPKKNLILGVTLPYDARQNDEVKAIVKRFLLCENLVIAVLTLLLIPELILNRGSVMLLWVMTWLIFALALPGVPFVIANKKLKALKEINGWYGESTGVALVDIRLAVTPKRLLSLWWFAPAAAVSLVPVIHTIITLQGRDEFWPLLIVYLSFFALCAASWFLYKIILRQKAEVVDENTTVNASLTQIRLYNWGKSWILIVWLTALFDLIFWLSGFNSAAVMLLTVAYSILLLIFIMLAEFKTRRMQQKLTAESGKAVYTDDDDKWLFGMLYNNPNDQHFMVNKRTGIGTTMNLARAPGKILIVFSALLILSLPAVGLWMMREESTPVSLAVTDTQLIAKHSGTVFTLELTDIETVSILDKLPSDGVRTNGTAMSTILKGNFRFEGIGPCRLCLNPQVPPFLIVTTADQTYIFGSNAAGGTDTVYDELVSLRDPQGVA